jgi:hypothetical protein
VGGQAKEVRNTVVRIIEARLCVGSRDAGWCAAAFDRDQLS